MLKVPAAVSRALSAFGWTPTSLVGVVLAVLLFLPQFSQVVYYIAQNTDSRDVVGALDDDAGNAIDIASHSYWFTSNGFYPYGPVYFRVAHMIGNAMSPITEPGGLADQEAASKSMHFALVLVSLTCGFLLSFLIASVFARELWAKVGISVWLLWAFLNSSVWQTYLLRAHPDFLLALCISAATLATVRAWQKPDEEFRLNISAWLWGLTLSVKMTVLFWLPFVALGLFLPWKRQNLKAAGKYTLHAAAVFFLVGFPQNFNLYKIFRFLRLQSHLSMPADAASITEWLTSWSGQIAWPLAVIVVLWALTSKDWRVLPKWPLLWRALILGFGPFTLLMMQKFLAPHTHYPMPVVATQLSLLAGLAPVANRLSGGRAVLVLFLSLLTFSFLHEIPSSFANTLKVQQVCRPEARRVAQELRALTGQQKKIYVDPYVPIMSHLPGVYSTWTISRDYVRNGNFDILILSQRFFGRYLNGLPDEYSRRDNLEWKSAVDFYSLFKDLGEVKSPDIGNWTKTAEDACGWQVWTKTN